MTQDWFDFTGPPVSSAEWQIPFQTGSHSSWTGARVAVQTYGMKTSAILQLLAGGDKTRQELAGLTGFSINAICSCVNGLLRRKLIERTGEYDTVQFDRGATKRERLRVTTR